MSESLEAIGADVRVCRLCKLCETRTVGVPGEGSPDTEIMFIGEGPGFHEDQQGRPFVGAAGGLLTEMLRGIGLRREDVFITNVVRCRPPGNRDPMRDLHGRTREWNGITCLAMYHPAFILRTPTVELRRIYDEDFRKIPPLLEEARRKRAALAAVAVAAEAATPLDQLRLF